MPEDEDPIMVLLIAMHAEESAEPVDEVKVRFTLRRLIERDRGVVGIIRGKARIEGTIGLDLDTVWYSSAKHLNKLWLYVHDEHRKSTHAKTMLEFSKWYSDQVGIPLMADELCGPNTDAKVKLVGRQLPESGKMFVYNPRQVAVPVLETAAA